MDRVVLLSQVTRKWSIDQIAITLSGLCLAHCLMTAVLVTVLASAGGLLVSPHVHEIGLVFAMILGAIGLGRGVAQHGYAMPVWIGSLGLGVMAGTLKLDHGLAEAMLSILGVAIVALGHDLNRRAVV
jgi:MerC mercury resistance protein